MKKHTGFTLIELMITVAILAILALMAMPSYRNMQNRAQLRSAIAEWQTSFQYAQSEAMRLRRSITLCASTDGNTCTDSAQFDQGWIVADCSESNCAGGTANSRHRILRDTVLPNTRGLELSFNNGGDKLAILANGNISYDGGLLSNTLAAKIKDGDKVNAESALVISREGRMRYSNNANDSDDSK